MSSANLSGEAKKKIKRTEHVDMSGSSRVAVTVWAIRPGVGSSRVAVTVWAIRPGVYNSLSSETKLSPVANEYQGYLLRTKGVRCVARTTLPHSRDDCLEILRASTSWSRKGLSRHEVG